MATQTPSQILRKNKKVEEKKPDNDPDDKKGVEKGNKRSALIDFIAKNKKNAA